MQELFDQLQQLFSFAGSILICDLTNVYYHGKERGKLPRYGRSKEKRSDCPLVTLALDASGFPLRAEIIGSIVSEPKRFKSALSRLNGCIVTVMMDAGISTAANLAWLKAQDLDWICIVRSLPEGPCLPALSSAWSDHFTRTTACSGGAFLPSGSS